MSRRPFIPLLCSVDVATVTIKGREYSPIAVRDSYNRRAEQYTNTLITKFKKLGITEDDLDISQEKVAFRKSPAFVSFYVDGRHLYFSYDRCSKFVENLYVVMKVLERELEALDNDEITVDDFVSKFAEERDVAEARKHAREILGVDAAEKDMDAINKAYKELAKEHHPDKQGGDTEKFKQINNAHKLLKRELV